MDILKLMQCSFCCAGEEHRPGCPGSQGQSGGEDPQLCARDQVQSSPRGHVRLSSDLYSTTSCSRSRGQLPNVLQLSWVTCILLVLSYLFTHNIEMTSSTSFSSSLFKYSLLLINSVFIKVIPFHSSVLKEYHIPEFPC